MLSLRGWLVAAMISLLAAVAAAGDQVVPEGPADAVISAHLNSAHAALEELRTARGSDILASIAAAEKKLPSLEAAASSATAKSERLQHAVAQQEGAVQNLRAMILESERDTDTSEAVYQHTEEVLRNSLRPIPATAAAPAAAATAAQSQDLTKTVQAVMSKELGQRLEAHERQVDAINKQMDTAVASKKAEASAILEEAKTAASMLMEHARKEDNAATAAAAVSVSNNHVLKDVGSVAAAALQKITAPDQAT